MFETRGGGPDAAIILLQPTQKLSKKYTLTSNNTPMIIRLLSNKLNRPINTKSVQ
jgi:hypothetical protein